MKQTCLFLISINLFFIACQAQNKCDDTYKTVFTNTGKKDVFGIVHAQGKAAIPCLIELIDMDKKSMVGFLNPISSNIPTFIFNNYQGIDAAYLIELILSKESIDTVKSEEWEQRVKPYRIYIYSVIVKTENGKSILAPLEYQDMKAIKNIYLVWWEKNKNKPIEVLRKEWKDNKRILHDKGYTWI